MAGTKQQLYLLNILGTRKMMQKLNATSGYLNIFHCFPPRIGSGLLLKAQPTVTDQV